MLSGRNPKTWTQMLRDEMKIRRWKAVDVLQRLQEHYAAFELKRVHEIIRGKGRVKPLTLHEAMVFHEAKVVDIIVYAANSDYHHNQNLRKYF